jgi:4'-phosphopantetheinyl transferase
VADLEIIWKKPAAQPPLEGAQIHVWAALVDESSDGPSELASILSPNEVERAKRFRFLRDQSRFVQGRLALRRILAHYTRVEPAALKFDYGSHGKPVIAGLKSGTTLHFNMSHSDGLALISVTALCPVGIDVERVRSLNDIADVAKRFFSPGEIGALNGAPDDQKFEAFFDLWTRKEALLKATGEGLTNAGLQLETLSMLEKSDGRVHVRLGPVSLTGWTLHRLEPAKGFRAALAVSAAEVEVVTGLWSSLESLRSDE